MSWYDQKQGAARCQTIEHVRNGGEVVFKVLDEHGAKMRYQEFDGGHSMEFWREELGDALRWALG